MAFNQRSDWKGLLETCGYLGVLLLTGAIAWFAAGQRAWFSLLPVLITLVPFYGGWLLYLCNNVQHVGLQDNVPDFRLCCWTFVPNPFVRFLYWHMNYHTEHHMYIAVPCYDLRKLHENIKADLPPSPVGLRAAWKETIAILKKQQADPSYHYAPELPVHRGLREGRQS